jgi:hypothetical protein
LFAGFVLGIGRGRIEERRARLLAPTAGCLTKALDLVVAVVRVEEGFVAAVEGVFVVALKS